MKTLNKKLLTICASLFLISSCSTKPQTTLNQENNKASIVSIIVPPKQEITKADITNYIDDIEPDWHKNEQNSGIIDFTKENGWEITTRALAKYNSLVKKYGSDFVPELKKDSGVTFKDKKIYINQEHIVKFATMNMKNKDL